MTAFFVFFGVVALFIVGVFVLIAVTGVKNRRVLKDAGIDPLTAQAQLAVPLANSRLLAPKDAEQSLEQRLTELADLHSRGVISDTELATARAKALEQ